MTTSHWVSLGKSLSILRNHHTRQVDLVVAADVLMNSKFQHILNSQEKYKKDSGQAWKSWQIRIHTNVKNDYSTSTACVLMICICLIPLLRLWKLTCNKCLSSLSLIACVSIIRRIMLKLITSTNVFSHSMDTCHQTKANQLNALHWDRQISGAVCFITSPIIVNRHPAGLADEPVMPRHVCVCVFASKRN